MTPERLAELVADHQRRQATRRQERAELDTARQHGLRRRHANKLAHLATQQSTQDPDMTGGAGLGPDSRARGRVGLPAVGDRWSAAQVPVAEQEQLRSTVGALIRAERLAAGYGTRRLARAVGCARSTVQRLEAGHLRPREVTLRYLAAVLAVDNPKPLADRLVAAAGELLRPDTDNAIRYRKRRADAALLAGHHPLPAELDRRVRLHRAGSAAWYRAQRLLDRPGALDDPELLGEANRLLLEARRLHAEAGPNVVIMVGPGQITAGWP